MTNNKSHHTEAKTFETKNKSENRFSTFSSFAWYLLLVLGGAFFFLLMQNGENPEESAFKNTQHENTTSYTDSDMREIYTVFTRYVEGGAHCDVQGAEELISQPSKEIMHFTCSNYKAETACHFQKEYEILVRGDEAIVHFADFSLRSGWPYFFVHEFDGWKIDFHKMAFGIAMGGGGCASGWSWRDNKTEDDFCSYFEPGDCPERK